MPSPSATNQILQERRAAAISAGVASLTPVYVASARGAIVRDVEGREYIDFGGGIGVMNIGHCHPRVVAAIREQAEKFHHTCFMVSPYEVAVRLAEALCRVTPGAFPKKALFVNSRAEAVENAVKIARYFTKRPAVIVFENAYHGRTLLTMTMTSKVKPYKLGFGPIEYINRSFEHLETQDVVSGLVKAAVFGFLLTLMGCYHGYRSRGGAQGVGAATTRAVVSASILILIANYVVTELFFAR